MFGTVVVVAIVVMRFLQPPAVVPQSEPPKTVSATTQQGGATEQMPDPVKPPDDLATAAIRLELRRLSDDGDKLLRSTDELKAESELWQTDVLALLTNDAGKTLASQPINVAAFDELISRPRPTPADIQATRLRAGEFLVPIKAALEAPKPQPVPAGVAEQLAKEHSRIQEHVVAFRTDRKQVQAWLLAGGTPASQTLQEAIAATHAKTAQETAATVAAKMQALHAEEAELAPFQGEWYEPTRRVGFRIAGREGNATTLAGSFAPGQRRLIIEKVDGVSFEGQWTYTDATLHPIRGELVTADEMKLATGNTEWTVARTDRPAAERRKEDLEQLANDKQVQDRYTAFLRPGRYSFARDKVLAQPPSPASYAALVKRSILSDIQYFAYSICGRGDINNRFFNNDRPGRSDFPKSDADWKKYRTLFNDFQDLAPIWRDMGLLAP